MSDASATFCMKCGAPLDPGGGFCMTCGTPSASPVQPQAAAGGFAAVHTFAGGAASAVGTVTALGGGMMALPWQTIAAGETPDLRALMGAGAPIAQQVVRSSLRVPAVALLVTTALDVVVALVSGQPAAMQMVAVRAVLGIGTSVIGMIAGNKAGPLRRIAGIASLVTGLFQTGSVLLTALSGVITPATLLGLLPSLVSQVSSLAMLVKTAIVSLKK